MWTFMLKLGNLYGWHFMVYINMKKQACDQSLSSLKQNVAKVTLLSFVKPETHSLLLEAYILGHQNYLLTVKCLNPESPFASIFCAVMAIIVIIKKEVNLSVLPGVSLYTRHAAKRVGESVCQKHFLTHSSSFPFNHVRLIIPDCQALICHIISIFPETLNLINNFQYPKDHSHILGY